jgi:sterol desaturase/sphingolipid hydroxylase (fatty acid hydroxylase superfamily)
MSESTGGKRADTTRMFESNFLEYFSRIHPVTPFVAWVPVMVLMLFRSQQRHFLGLPSTVGLFLLGLLIWTFLEYVLHRWVFHWMKDTPAGRRIHFLLHGVHHEYPNDKDRLVMPLGFSIPLGILIYLGIYFAIGQLYGEAIYAGMVLGYLGYDGTHYAVHHFRQKTRIGRFVKRHHMLHHHIDNEGGFGVSSPLWDVVFGTMPRPKQRAVPGSPARLPTA